jgi:hypothetical protein
LLTTWITPRAILPLSRYPHVSPHHHSQTLLTQAEAAPDAQPTCCTACSRLSSSCWALTPAASCWRRCSASASRSALDKNLGCSVRQKKQPGDAKQQVKERCRQPTLDNGPDLLQPPAASSVSAMCPRGQCQTWYGASGKMRSFLPSFIHHPLTGMWQMEARNAGCRPGAVRQTAAHRSITAGIMLLGGNLEMPKLQAAWTPENIPPY